MKKYNVWAIVEEIDDGKDENGKDICARKLAKFESDSDAIGFIEDVWVDDILEKHNGKYPYE